MFLQNGQSDTLAIRRRNNHQFGPTFMTAFFANRISRPAFLTKNHWKCHPLLRVLVKALSALSAETSCCHHFLEKGAGTVFTIVETGVESFHDIQTNIKSNQIRQAQRPHGMVHAELHHRVYGLHRAYSFEDAEDGLIDHWHQYPVRDESRGVIYYDTHFIKDSQQFNRSCHSIAGSVHHPN